MQQAVILGVTKTSIDKYTNQPNCWWMFLAHSQSCSETSQSCVNLHEILAELYESTHEITPDCTEITSKIV